MDRADRVGVKHGNADFGELSRAVPSVQNDKELSKAKSAAYRHLTYRPRSRAEVQQKLLDKGFHNSVVLVVMADLDRLGYVDDKKFANQWARSRVRIRGFGRRRIEQELRNKGVGRDVIQEALSDVFDHSAEADLARREAEKKLKTLTRFEPEVRRRRLAGYLERKGFSADSINSVLHSLT